MGAVGGGRVVFAAGLQREGGSVHQRRDLVLPGRVEGADVDNGFEVCLEVHTGVWVETTGAVGTE